MAVHADDNLENARNKCVDSINEKISNCIHQRSARLDLSKTNLSQLPDSIFSLSHVKYIYLRENKIQSLPEEFACSFSQLLWLDLRSNHLKELPQNIFHLKNLKNLLLDDNNIEALPLPLGLLQNLSGLNLSNNPLKFPPKNIIEAGTKKIISYLREQLAIEQRFGNLDTEDVVESVIASETYSDTEDDLKKEQDINTKAIPQIKRFDPKKAIRRLSIDDDIINDLPYSVNSILISTRDTRNYVPPLKTREYSSAPVRKTRQRNILKQNHSAVDGQSKKKTPFEIEIEKADKKRFNEKADSIIQRKKNERTLEDWRKQTKDLQRLQPKQKEHEISLPYGNNRDVLVELKHPHAEHVKKALANDPRKSALKNLRDQQLQARIKEHFNNIKSWKNLAPTMSAEDEVRNAKKNLDEALKLHREFEEKRALEYRLRAFTADDYGLSSNKKVS